MRGNEVTLVGGTSFTKPGLSTQGGSHKRWEPPPQAIEEEQGFKGAAALLRGSLEQR